MLANAILHTCHRFSEGVRNVLQVNHRELRDPHIGRRVRHEPLNGLSMTGEADQQFASPDDGAYWSIAASDVLRCLETCASGLAASESAARLGKFSRNTPASKASASPLAVFARQFRSPLVLILIFAASVSAIVGEGQLRSSARSSGRRAASRTKRGRGQLIDRGLELIRSTRDRRPRGEA